MARIYPSMDDVLALHERQIELYGGAEGIRDPGLIEGALQRPRMGYYSGLVEEAAALWESLAMNHGFIDSNKRVAFAATYSFLRANGAAIIAEEEEPAEFVLGFLEKGEFKKDALEDWLHKHISQVER